jgi:uncharacterized repeat protein (TIGR01451 family)
MLAAMLAVGVLWLAYGAASTLADPTTPSTTGIAISELARVGNAGAFAPGLLAASVGQTVEYKIVVTNTGDTALTVTLSDPSCDSGTIDPTGTPTLAPAGTERFYCTHLLAGPDAGSFVNLATATGETVSARVGPVTSSVLVKVSATGVLGARKIVVGDLHRSGKSVTRVKAVAWIAHDAWPVVNSAGFTR